MKEARIEPLENCDILNSVLSHRVRDPEKWCASVYYCTLFLFPLSTYLEAKEELRELVKAAGISPQWIL